MIKCRCCGKPAKEIYPQWLYKAVGYDSAEEMAEDDGTYEELTESVLCNPCYVKGVREGRWL